MLKKCAAMSAVPMTVFCARAEAATTCRQLKNYAYQIENRKDPFQPFLIGLKSAPSDLPAAPSEERGGLPLEPGQLTLAALVSAPGGWRRALPNDMTGKGYFLYEGLPVGKYGTVRKIEAGQVLIGESWRTASGRLVAKETVMRLKTEGEQ